MLIGDIEAGRLVEPETSSEPLCAMTAGSERTNQTEVAHAQRIGPVEETLNAWGAEMIHALVERNAIGFIMDGQHASGHPHV